MHDTPRSVHARRGFWLILLALVVEGYDLQAANFAAPAVVASFGIAKAEVGPLLSASLVGVLLGSILIGPLGDRIGRRRLLISCCIGYGLLSLVAAAAPSFEMLVGLRFLIGLGLGGFLPNALALASELAPPGREAGHSAMVGIGITLGGVLAGALSAQLMPDHGWQAVFLMGGVLPLGIALLLWLALPESPAIDREPAPHRRPGNVRALLSPSYLVVSLATWLLFALVLMNVYLLSGWIPLLMQDAGFDLASSAWIATAYHAGGVAGGILASLYLARRGWRAVALFAALSAATLLVLSIAQWPAAILTLLIVMAGLFVTGTQNGINGAAAGTYPATIRAAGLGWALGMGRIGSIAGPLVGSLAVMMGMTETRHFFLIPILPLTLAGVLALWLAGRTTTEQPKGERS
jgi:AAHS family 4-hydroxybenzoate transporter-like MFS transporter